MFYSSTQPNVHAHPDCEIVVGDLLFAWRGAGIVLIAERDGANWVLARGWRAGDRLTDVRRWVFTDAKRFIGQVRRLVLDATSSSPNSIDAADAAAGWVVLRQQDRPGVV